MKFSLTSASLALLLCFLPLHAADIDVTITPDSPDVPASLDLPTAVRYALENNFAIRQARERIREQEGLIVEIKARVIPNVSLNSSYTKTDKDLIDTAGRSDQNWVIALEARQALYAGGGIKAALSAQKLSRDAALLDLRSVINQALLEVRVRFYDVLLAREQIQVQEQNTQLLREQLQNAKNRFEAGTVSNFEVLRSEVTLANAQPELIRARNRLRTSVDELRRTLGYINTEQQNMNRVPEFVGTLDFTPVNYELQPALEAARLNRPEIQRLSRLTQAREAAVDFAKAGYKPTLDAVAGYQLVKATRSEDFDDSLHGWVAGVQSSWAIFDGRATAGRVAQARSQLRQTQLTLGEQILAVEVEVRRALSSLQEALELAEAAGKVVGQGEEALRLADARYGAGTATQLDVLGARFDLTTARINQVQANYSYNVAVANLRKAIGEADTYVEPAAPTSP